MNHLTEEQLIDYQYDEGTERVEIEQHLRECAECSALAQKMAHDLSEIEAAGLNTPMPERDSAYGERMWQSVRSSLTPHRVTSRAFSFGWKWKLGLALAGAAAVLTVVAFYSGRLWEQKRAGDIAAINAHASQQNVILFVISDHLDRSQRLLAELNDPDVAAKDPALQENARELLTENRLYRQSASHSAAFRDVRQATIVQDTSLKSILDKLEPVLVELANQPDGLDSKEILRVRREMNTGSLLFEIHVLRGKVSNEQTSESAAQKSGNGLI